MKPTDNHFRDLMKSYRPAKAPANLTVEVMNRIHAEPDKITEYKPVINQWFLRVVYACIGGIILYSMFQTNAPANGAGSSFVDKVMGTLPPIDLAEAANATEKVTGFLGNVPQIVFVIFLSATFLLLLDQFFLKKRNMQHNSRQSG